MADRALSPAARAILEAYDNSPWEYDTGDLTACAAVLRAAADQWKNEIREQPSTEFISGIKNCIDALDEFAAELEAQ